MAPDDRHFLMVEPPPAALGRGARLVEVDHWRPDSDVKPGG